MAWTLIAGTSQTATIGTEHTLGSASTVNGTFVYEIDMSAMAAGDYVELRVRGKTLTGGADGLMWKSNYGGLQVYPRVQSPPIPSDISITITLKQTAGTGRAFPWKLLQV